MFLNRTFNALCNEASFTKDILGAGATQIRKANYAQKGMYFQAFTSLSTGLERIAGERYLPHVCYTVDPDDSGPGDFGKEAYHTTCCCAGTYDYTGSFFERYPYTFEKNPQHSHRILTIALSDNIYIPGCL